MLAVTTALKYLIGFYPSWMRTEIEAALPAMALDAVQLGFQVLAAEHKGLPYMEAIDRPDCYLMGRVHHGLVDMVRWRLKKRERKAMREMFRRSLRFNFDDLHRLVFAVASRRGDPEAALARFLLVECICLNLLLATWHKPEIEASGALDRVKNRAERIVNELLATPTTYEDDVRPLHVLVAEMVQRLDDEVRKTRASLRGEFGLVIEHYADQVAALRITRLLDAPDAAVVQPGFFVDGPGSQQIADRFPHWFSTANSVESRRKRLRKRLRKADWQIEPSGERFVDVLMEEVERAGAECTR